MKNLFKACVILAMLTGCGTDEGRKVATSKHNSKEDLATIGQPVSDGGPVKLLESTKPSLSLSGSASASQVLVFRDVRISGVTKCLDHLDPELTLGIVACKGDRKTTAILQAKHVTQVCAVKDETDAPSEEWPLLATCDAGFEVFLSAFKPRMFAKVVPL